MEQINAYRRYFNQHPPTHLLVAAYLGYKPPQKPAPPAPPLPDIEE